MSDAGGMVLVANPHATRHDRDALDEVARACERHMDVAVVMTRSVEHMLEVVGAARDAGAAVVAVAGGDGSAAAAAGVIAQSPTALMPVPTGSTNVFARAQGWPMRTRDVPARVTAALEAPRRRLRVATIALDEGPARPFLVNAGVGIDAATVDWIEAHPEVKHTFKQLAFAVAAAGPGLAALMGGPHLLVEVDGTPGVKTSTVIAACGRPYVYVGQRALDLLPRADWDGVLEWLAITRPAPLSAGHHVLRALGRGGHQAGRALLGGMADEEIVVRAKRPVAAQADGEALGKAERITLRPGPELLVVAPPRA